jgi:hypothetical protein
MASANVEIVKRVTDAYNRADVEAFAEVIAPDFELSPWISGTVDSDSYHEYELWRAPTRTLSHCVPQPRVEPPRADADVVRALGPCASAGGCALNRALAGGPLREPR